ncbi:uncharacterized protein [Venturia canescens]|uniref:uncharacterized protein n=1 Tax=Venturia canescens TaxID=32260 RepID=UPI001C9CF960|nr:uncharacterized protein LOC122414903 [Venturia canescens]XP_043282505.1 uncharacterized protein LOC122414903 [Venturia canescens]XP_043282506.1 uncharacterized protein LOC122414903 [Venturia canescens]
MNEMDEATCALLERLNCQPNIVHMEIPYIPIPIKDIDAYTKLADYASDRIKMIETIGILEPVDTNVAFLVSTTDDPKCSLQLEIGHLRRDYAFPLDEEEGAAACGGLRHEYSTVRVFGTLKSINKVNVLVVDEILPVQNFVKCEKTLAIVAKLARTKYSMYNYEIEKNEQLREYLRRVAENYEQTE